MQGGHDWLWGAAGWGVASYQIHQIKILNEKKLGWRRKMDDERTTRGKFFSSWPCSSYGFTVSNQSINPV
jgi:hypothetical protein